MLGAGAAITSKLAQLQETARGLTVPPDVRANINANLANARDLIGLGNGAADATSDVAMPADVPRNSPARLEPIAEQPAGSGMAAATAAPDSGCVQQEQQPPYAHMQRCRQRMSSLTAVRPCRATPFNACTLLLFIQRPAACTCLSRSVQEICDFATTPPDAIGLRSGQ